MAQRCRPGHIVAALKGLATMHTEYVSLFVNVAAHAVQSSSGG